MFGAQAIEHGSSRSSRWLRGKRLRITLWIAAVEGLLYLVHVLHWWEAVVLAAIAAAIWWTGGRTSRSDVFRQGSWIFAGEDVCCGIDPVLKGSRCFVGLNSHCMLLMTCDDLGPMFPICSI